MFNTYLSEFAMSWKQFIRLPLPPFLQGEESDFPEIEGHNALLRPMMPVVGFVLGLMLTVPLWILRIFPRGRMTAALVGLIAIPLILEMVTSWHGLNSTALFFDLRRQGATRDEALSAVPQSLNQPRTAISCIFLMSIYLLRMIFCGTLAYFAPFWIVISLTGGWLVRAELSTLNISGGFGNSMIATRRSWEKRHWHIAIVLMILFGILHPIASLLAFAVAWLFSWFASNLCLESISGINRHAFELFGYSAELILFFLGILIYAASY